MKQCGIERGIVRRDTLTLTHLLLNGYSFNRY